MMYVKSYKNVNFINITIPKHAEKRHTAILQLAFIRVPKITFPKLSPTGAEELILFPYQYVIRHIFP